MALDPFTSNPLSELMADKTLRVGFRVAGRRGDALPAPPPLAGPFRRPGQGGGAARLPDFCVFQILKNAFGFGFEAAESRRKQGDRSR